MENTQPYTVKLDRFEGPMDLLLHLIRRAELDVTEIALATVTEQYLGHIEALRRIDVDEAGEFLVVAATLIEIKSRLVNPPDDEGKRDRETRSAEPIDPAAELLSQLLSYKAYRDAALELETRAETWAKRFPAARAGADHGALREAIQPEDTIDLEEVGLWELASAFQRIVSAVNFDRLGEHTVSFDETPIEVHQQNLVKRLSAVKGTPAMSLEGAFDGHTKSSAIGVFIAILELVRQQRLRVFRKNATNAGVGEAADHSDIAIELLPTTNTVTSDDSIGHQEQAQQHK